MIVRVLTREIHVSWHVATVALGICIGVIIVPMIDSNIFISIAWLLTGIGLMLTGCIKRTAWLLVLTFAAGLSIGLWRGSITQSDLSVYKGLTGKSLTIEAKVLEDVEQNKRGQTVARLGDIEVEGRKITGTLWVTIEGNSEILRSDNLQIKGKLSEGFGSFAGAVYGADLISMRRSQHGDIALAVRDWFSDGVRKAISDTEASLGLGFLTGQRRGLPEELDTALQAAGLTHIVVASGYNLTILVRFARRLFEKISKYLSLVTSGGMIVGFMAITGLSPSMSRAGLVAGLSLIAWYYGRRFHPLVLLPLAAAITLLIQPNYAWGDLGWQLSFAAFGGVMILAPLASAYFFGDKKENSIRRILIETISAQLATLPILLVAFGQLSVVAPLANILVLPLVPLAMLLTFIAGIGGLVMPVFASIFGFPAQIVLTYMTQLTNIVGGQSWALQEVEMSVIGASVFYACLIAFAVYMKLASGYNLRSASLVE